MQIQTPPQLKSGHCPSCGKKIIGKHPVLKTAVRLDGYGEFWVELDNGSRMKILLCKDCELSEKQVEKIMEKHRKFWKDKKLNKLESLKHTKFALREKEL